MKKFVMWNINEKIEGYGLKRFLLVVKLMIFIFLRENLDIKVKLVLKCMMLKIDFVIGEVEYIFVYFVLNVEINFKGIDVDDFYKRMLDKMLESLVFY